MSELSLKCFPTGGHLHYHMGWETGKDKILKSDGVVAPGVQFDAE